jgi:predicted RNase H-like HicB family nuclease
MNTIIDRAFNTMRTLDHYTIVLRPDTNGTFIAYVPAIVGCHAWAETAQTAREELNHVFAMICEEYLAAGRSLPQDVELVGNYGI